MCKGCILYINRKVQPCVKPITGSWGRTLVVRRTPPRNASKPLRTLSGTYPSLCLPYWSRGGQECPGGVLDGLNGPTGSQETIVVKQTPPRNASKPPKTVSGTYLSLCLPSWSRGGQECLDGGS